MYCLHDCIFLYFIAAAAAALITNNCKPAANISISIKAFLHSTRNLVCWVFSSDETLGCTHCHSMHCKSEAQALLNHFLPTLWFYDLTPRTCVYNYLKPIEGPLTETEVSQREMFKISFTLITKKVFKNGPIELPQIWSCKSQNYLQGLCSALYYYRKIMKKNLVT